MLGAFLAKTRTPMRRLLPAAQYRGQRDPRGGYCALPRETASANRRANISLRERYDYSALAVNSQVHPRLPGGCARSRGTVGSTGATDERGTTWSSRRSMAARGAG